MKRATNLSIFLIPMVICSVALGFGGMISSTENPIIPEIVEEEVLAEAPVEEPVVEVPEVVEIATPDPVVVEEPEIVVEEPEIVVEETRSNDPLDISLVGNNYLIGFTTEPRQTYDLDYSVFEGAEIDPFYTNSRGLTAEEIVNEVAVVPVPRPDGASGSVTIRIEADIVNGGTQSGDKEFTVLADPNIVVNLAGMTLNVGGTGTIIISNDGPGIWGLDVTDISLGDGTSFTVDIPPLSEPLMNGESIDADVTAIAPGMDIVTITSDDPDTPSITVTVNTPQEINVPPDLDDDPTDQEPPVVLIENLGFDLLVVTGIDLDLHYSTGVTFLVGVGQTKNLADELALHGISLPVTEGSHSITIWSNDPDEPMVEVTYDIGPAPVATFLVTGDMAVGIGSERFGVSIEHDTLDVTYTVTAWLEDASGTKVSPEETTTIKSNGELLTTKIPIKIKFLDAGQDYQYHVEIEGVNTYTITGVSLNHWSDFESLRNAGTNWEAIVSWDPVAPEVLAAEDIQGEISVYVALRKWDGTNLWDVFDSEGEMVITSENLADGNEEELADGQALLTLVKPDSKNLGTTPVANGEVFMSGYGAGYYFFTFMAPTNSGPNPWADRIGCPPEGL